MEKGKNQKMKLLYFIKIFIEKIDETHSIIMPGIQSSIEILCCRWEKSIYVDLEASS